MKERQILFSAPMVLALLAGTKSQTRRVVKWRPSQVMCSLDCLGEAGPDYQWPDRGLGAGGYLKVGCKDGASQRVFCPHGEPGNHLWVRETWAYNGQGSRSYGPKEKRREGYVTYAADNKRVTSFHGEGPMLPSPKQTVPQQADDEDDFDYENRKTDYYRKYFSCRRPSIFMPRWASRLTLEVTGVRVERLQDISDDDARAEGLERRKGSPNWFWPGGVEGFGSPRACYLRGWDSINGKGAAEKNPWVWCISFRRLAP